MSLGLWSFFWNRGAAPAPTPSPSPTPAPNPYPPAPMPAPPDSTAGGGHNRHDIPAPLDLWEVREKYLRSLQPTITPAPRPEDYQAESNRKYVERQQQLEQLQSDKAAAVIALRSAQDIKTMKRIGGQITELNAKIATLTAKQSVARFLR